MSLPTNPGRKADIAVAAAVVAGAAGIFWLPWHIPPGARVASWSYTYGFSNVAADVAMAGLLLALFLIALRRRKAQGSGATERVLAEVLSGDDAGHGAGGLRAAFLIVTALSLVLVIAVYRLLPYVDYGEYAFFTSRLDLMVLGLKPFRDFQFNYGPAMLYPTYWLYALSRGALSIDGADGVTLVAHWVAGLWLLYYVVGNLRGGVNKALVFVCMSFPVGAFSMGLQYTPLRYVDLTAALFFIHRAFAGRKNDGAAAIARIAAYAFVLPLAVLSLSQEIGIACAAGVAAYFAALAFTPSRQWAWVALAPCAAFAAVLAVFSRDYLDVILARTSSGSGDTLPLFPTDFVLLLAGAACWVLPQLGVLAFCGNGGSGGPDARGARDGRGALPLALCVSFGLLIPASFTHCDAGHVIMNGLGLLTLFLAFALRLENKTVSRTVVCIFILICPLGGSALCVKYYLPSLRGAWDTRVDRSLAERQGLFDEAGNDDAWHAVDATGIVYGKLGPLPEGIQQLLKYPRIGMPLGCAERIERFIKLSGRYVPEYYTGIDLQMWSEAAIAHKLDDMRRMDIIIVPKIFISHYEYMKESDYVASDTEFLRSVLLFPVSLKAARNPRLMPYNEIISSILADYSAVGDYRDCWIMKREPGK